MKKKQQQQKTKKKSVFKWKKNSITTKQVLK